MNCGEVGMWYAYFVVAKTSKRRGAAVARKAHNLQIVGLIPTTATKFFSFTDAVGGQQCKATVSVFIPQPPSPTVRWRP